jgi:2-polyprenyl-6-methoxyphenol hydroxylase-like FAD-dependent oxidoreductase
MKQPPESKAIVIGGGIAGLMAARVLCNHFVHVIVVERDVYPDAISPRNGTPQSNQVHVLLLKGKQILTALFPDLERNLLSNGAHKIDLIADAKYHLATGWSLTFDSKMTTLACTRQLLEYALRKELMTNFPNVEFNDNTRVTGLLLDLIEEEKDNRRKLVRGVKTIHGGS